MKNIAILGSGGWGVALSLILNKNGHNVKLWSYTEEEKNIINNERKCKFLPQAVIPEGITCYNGYDEVINDADYIIVVTPSSAIRGTMNAIKDIVKENQVIILASKGIEPGTQKIYTDVIEEIFPNNKIGAISGPSHAEEVSRFIPTCVVVSSKDDNLSHELQELFMNDIFRVYINNDLLGVELGAALKNIIALASGICAGMELGDNSQAALITRGLLEITRIGVAMGANHDTFYGLTGFGDLFVTCASLNSRNRRCGTLIGQGHKAQEAKEMLGGMVVEGMSAVDAAMELIQKYDIYAPIITEMYEVIHNDKPAKEAVADLMQRSGKNEF
ncbi:MAG: NAD(P)-dependent glycerol-3-phosphate dehydrogenase [Clostridia bacterium]|nr:NAD(P)-dependent glycerol-3-phosphate dehydrogenase [Clostridia bacterium]